MGTLSPENLCAHRRGAIEDLIKGRARGTVAQLQILFGKPTGDHDRPEELLVKLLTFVTKSLSQVSLSSCEDCECEVTPIPNQVGSMIGDQRSVNSGESRKRPAAEDWRVCYKRRKISEMSMEILSITNEDGHPWRKYGSPISYIWLNVGNILNGTCYFRCIHKFDRGCQATKLVQRIQEAPHMYRTTYFGHHTCRSYLLNNPSQNPLMEAHLRSFSSKTFSDSESHSGSFSSIAISTQYTSSRPSSPSSVRSFSSETISTQYTSSRPSSPSSVRSFSSETISTQYTSSGASSAASVRKECGEAKVYIGHLLKACGEAMENRNKELVEVILKRLENKACPQGEAAQRLVYYMIKSLGQHFDYLTQEASKYYVVAFRAFYQIFPYGRFAHFIATSSILEAIPVDAEQICIVDFDMGEGVQWPPLIEAFAKQRQRVTRIISLKSDDSKSVHPLQRFEKTKERLSEFAFSSGLELRIEEIDLEGLVSEMKKMMKFGGREFLAFNCMVGLPHMGRLKSSSHVSKFLKIAQESIYTGDGTRNRGVITYGDIGTTVEERRSDGGYGFGSVFEGLLGRVTALLESMEWQMPLQYKEARIAMECLFVAPYVSSLSCFEKWDEREYCRDGHLAKIGLDARRVSKDVVSEAKEIVRDGDSLYQVGTRGERENQVVLCFEGTPVVGVSRWS